MEVTFRFAKKKNDSKYPYVVEILDSSFNERRKIREWCTNQLELGEKINNPKDPYYSYGSFIYENISMRWVDYKNYKSQYFGKKILRIYFKFEADCQWFLLHHSTSAAQA